jgi:hypothetical protein
MILRSEAQLPTPTANRSTVIVSWPCEQDFSRKPESRRHAIRVEARSQGA